MRLTHLFLILIFAAVASAQGAAKCFQNDALKGPQIINFKISGDRVAGTFEYENGESELARVYKFTGTRAGNRLKVAFANNEMPDVQPSVLKDLNWRLETFKGKEILRIVFRGKNYQTNRYSDYVADFVPCDAGNARLGAAAQTVRFAKGKNSATVALSFKTATEQKVFSINARRDQTLEITAEGCAISVYTPDGKLYEFVEWESGAEKTYATSTIDRLRVERLPADGNYIITLRKMADAAQPRVVTFAITK